jgi:chorismate mutase/prephenate dehydratase
VNSRIFKSHHIFRLGDEQSQIPHQAAIQKFGASLHCSAQKTIGDVFTEVAKQTADYGVVPVENSTEGAGVLLFH